MPSAAAFSRASFYLFATSAAESPGSSRQASDEPFTEPTLLSLCAGIEMGIRAVNRLTQGVLLVGSLVVATVVVLAMALPWDHDHCKIDYPTLISCTFQLTGSASGTTGHFWLKITP